jgi:molecular chaperone Hsp33
MNRDYLVRATALDERVRAFALNATGVVSELRRRHDTSPVVTAALGRTAMGALLIAAATLKEEDQLLTVDVKGDGPAGRLVVTANGRGEVRGLVGNPHAHAESTNGKLNVSGVVGSKGFLSVTKHLGMKESYQGTVELLSGEIGDDLTYYLAQSEQTPSAVGVGVFTQPDATVVAGGYMIQLLPGLSEKEIGTIEERIAALPHPTQLLRDGATPEQILERIFPEGYTLGDRQPVRFHCPCSRERFEAGIVSLGHDEVQRIIDEEEEQYTEVVCHFCNESYRFSLPEMEAILEAAR